MPAVDVQGPVVGDRAEAGNGFDQIGKTQVRRTIALRRRESSREGQREDKAGDRLERSCTSHDASVARHDDRRLHQRASRHACSA